MYNSAFPAGIMGAMSEITVSDARARLADVVDAARVGHDPVYLTRRGQRVAAVIDAEDLDRLIASAEDLADIEAAKAARAEIADGDATIPWEQVEVAPAAVRQLRKLDPPARRRVQAAIELLADQPRPSGAKKLVGGEGEWRVRTGDYRIVYEVHDDVLVVLVVAVGHRRDIYERR